MVKFLTRMKLSKSLSIFEKTFLKSEKLFTLISQIVFFNAAESALLGAGQRATSLFTLMLFNGFAYSFSYLHHLITSSNWRQLETVSSTSEIPHLAMSATKLTLEWTKFIVFFMTVVTTCLAGTLGASMQGFSPSPIYLLLTGAYFIVLEEKVAAYMPRLLTSASIPIMEGEEAVWSPIILKGCCLFLSSILIMICTYCNKYKAAFTTFLICFYLKIRDLQINGYEKLRRLEAYVARFPKVTTEELALHDDVCSICLADMRRARRTFCGHIFHPVCLARALKTGNSCPVCKQDL